MTQLVQTTNDQVEEEEVGLSQLERTIIIHRLCADAKPPHGKTIPKEVLLPDITIENEFTDESSNEQTTDSHEKDTAHHRSTKKTIGRKRTHDCSAFVTDKEGIDKKMLTELIEDKLFGAFKNIVPSYLNASGQDEIMSQSRISFKVDEVGKTEENPESQMVQTNGMTKGTIWRYAEVLTYVKGKVTFTSTKLKPKKLREYVDKTLFQRIGTFHNVNQRIGTVEIVD